MSAIGPGDWVQAVESISTDFGTLPAGSITEGAIYQVRHASLACGRGSPHCEGGYGLKFVGEPDRYSYHAWGKMAKRWCVCHFRLWPPPADEALRCEPVDADEPVSVPA